MNNILTRILYENCKTKWLYYFLYLDEVDEKKKNLYKITYDHLKSITRALKLKIRGRNE